VAVPFPRRPAVRAGSVARGLATVRAALALLTRLPVRPTDAEASGAAAFPLVGVLVGLCGAVPLALLAASEPMLAGLFAIAATTILTGALHLDGLADTADALLAPNPIQAERARKDPAVGSGGVVALILVLGIEVVALAGLATSAGVAVTIAAFVVAAVVARTLPVVAVVLAPQRADPAGFGGWFAARVRPADGVVAVVIAGLISVGATTLAGSAGVALGGCVGAAAGLAAAAVIVRGRGQLDGDGLGAIVELTVAATLAAAAILAAAVFGS
jgi:adenosylcobinamide-GDP ribazoletransferase